MKKRWMRIISILMVCTITLGSAANVPAAASDAPSDVTAADDEDAAPDSVPASGAAADGTAADGADGTGGDEPVRGPEAPVKTPPADVEPGDAPVKTDPGVRPADDGQDEAADNANDTDTGIGINTENGAKPEPGTETGTEKKNEDFSGTVTVDEEELKGIVTVEEDKNDDKVEIKKNDKPYLALGQDLTAEQRATVLALMGVDAAKLDEYDVVYVNNSEEHQYLGSYIDSSKIGSRSLSSIVIVERGAGNGIQISTNNISYCTVGMYKNALATAGIQNADIIVAAPFPISGTAALVGVFKAYTEMTGDQIDEENIDAALHELVVTGALEASGGDADEVEGLIAYVKQAVVEHDLSNEADIRDAIAEGCKKFNITLNDEEMEEVVKLMQKIGELDLDLDKLLNAAQSIYDKISHAEGGFWAKIREIINTLIAKIRELF